MTEMSAYEPPTAHGDFELKRKTDKNLNYRWNPITLVSILKLSNEYQCDRVQVIIKLFYEFFLKAKLPKVVRGLIATCPCQHCKRLLVPLELVPLLFG